jgi:phosphatidylinositol N-acetylglucosaminyltransferase subunit P
MPHQTGAGAASSVEVYGFAGWIASAVAFVAFLLWAVLPESALHAMGITYYPSKHWALAIPLWLVILVLYVYWAYEW